MNGVSCGLSSCVSEAWPGTAQARLLDTDRLSYPVSTRLFRRHSQLEHSHCDGIVALSVLFGSRVPALPTAAREMDSTTHGSDHALQRLPVAL